MGSAGHPRGRLAILAGAGRFPFHVAQAAARQGQAVTAFGLRGWVDRGLAQQVPAYEEVDVGRIGTLLERLKALQITDVIMAGKVTKDVLLTQAHTFDAETQALVQGARDMSVNGLLGALAQRLAREGILATGVRYAVNYFWVLLTGRPFTITSDHKRTHLASGSEEVGGRR